MKFYRKIAYLFILLCFTTALAQDGACSAMVQQAMAQVQDGCAQTGRNQACYGYVSLDATPRDGVANFSFSHQGDLANVADIDTLRLAALSVDDDQWGIALMKLQANLPDTLPGQNVTFLLFGDVQITNAVAPGAAVQPATVSLTLNSNANIRSTPSTTGQVIGSLGKGDVVTANGRNADGTWLRVQIPDNNAQGWVFGTLVTPASDVNTLSVVASTDETVAYKPMQAFYFKTGIDKTSCAEAPQDGILIQTPKGAGQISLRANDVDIQLGSTAFLQAEPNANMTISVVEGEGHVTVDGKTVAVPAGTQVTIPIDADLKATGAPSDAKPYAPALVAPLPIQDLPEAITIAPPASGEVTTSSPAGNASDLSGLNVPGLDTSVFGGMSQAQFCAYMGQAFQRTGMSLSQYAAQMKQISGFLPADQKAKFNEFIAMLNSCGS